MLTDRGGPTPRETVPQTASARIQALGERRPTPCSGCIRQVSTSFHAYSVRGRHVENRREKAMGLYLITISFHIETDDEINCNRNLTVNNTFFSAKLSKYYDALQGKIAQTGPLNQSGNHTTKLALLVITKPPEDAFEQYPKSSNAKRNE